MAEEMVSIYSSSSKDEPVGFIEIKLDSTLDLVRKKIEEEVEFLPNEWRFLILIGGKSVRISLPQEKTKTAGMALKSFDHCGIFLQSIDSSVQNSSAPLQKAPPLGSRPRPQSMIMSPQFPMLNGQQAAQARNFWQQMSSETEQERSKSPLPERPRSPGVAPASKDKSQTVSVMETFSEEKLETKEVSPPVKNAVNLPVKRTGGNPASPPPLNNLNNSSNNNSNTKRAPIPTSASFTPRTASAAIGPRGMTQSSSGGKGETSENKSIGGTNSLPSFANTPPALLSSSSASSASGAKSPVKMLSPSSSQEKRNTLSNSSSSSSSSSASSSSNSRPNSVSKPQELLRKSQESVPSSSRNVIRPPLPSDSESSTSSTSSTPSSSPALTASSSLSSYNSDTNRTQPSVSPSRNATQSGSSPFSSTETENKPVSTSKPIVKINAAPPSEKTMKPSASAPANRFIRPESSQTSSNVTPPTFVLPLKKTSQENVVENKEETEKEEKEEEKSGQRYRGRIFEASEAPFPDSPPLRRERELRSGASSSASSPSSSFLEEENSSTPDGRKRAAAHSNSATVQNASDDDSVTKTNRPIKNSSSSASNNSSNFDGKLAHSKSVVMMEKFLTLRPNPSELVEKNILQAKDVDTQIQESVREVLKSIKAPIGGAFSSRTLRNFSSVTRRNSLVEVDDSQWKSEGAVKSSMSDYKLEHPEKYEAYYRDHFANQVHLNFTGMHPKIGPITASMLRAGPESTVPAIIRYEQQDERVFVEIQKKPKTGKDYLRLLKTFFPNLLSGVKMQHFDDPNLTKDLIQFEATQTITNIKIGLIFCDHGQTTDNEMFGNREGTPQYKDFLKLLGKEVVLKGFEGYNGGLDVKRDSTGTHSIYTKYEGVEVMFHVPTMIPYTPNDPQQVERKRHVGNDVVVIVFKHGDTAFSPTVMVNQFNHVFVIVQPVGERTGTNQMYKVAVAVKKGVIPFGPHIPENSLVSANDLRSFLLSKLINGERAAMAAPIFARKLLKARRELLQNLVSSDYEHGDDRDLITDYKEEKEKEKREKEKERELSKQISTREFSKHGPSQRDLKIDKTKEVPKAKESMKNSKEAYPPPLKQPKQTVSNIVNNIAAASGLIAVTVTCKDVTVKTNVEPNDTVQMVCDRLSKKLPECKFGYGMWMNGNQLDPDSSMASNDYGNRLLPLLLEMRPLDNKRKSKTMGYSAGNRLAAQRKQTGGAFHVESPDSFSIQTFDEVVTVMIKANYDFSVETKTTYNSTLQLLREKLRSKFPSDDWCFWIAGNRVPFPKTVYEVHKELGFSKPSLHLLQFTTIRK